MSPCHFRGYWELYNLKIKPSKQERPKYNRGIRRTRGIINSSKEGEMGRTNDRVPPSSINTVGAFFNDNDLSEVVTN